jgi:hypothetical protein
MADDQMLQEHRQTWNGFCRLMLWSIVAIVITLSLMAMFLT